MVSEFVAAVNQICAERGIDQEEVFKALESAVLSAYKKEFDKEQLENLNIELNRNTGEFKLVAMKTVAKKVNDADTEISLKEAQALNKKIKEGDKCFENYKGDLYKSIFVFCSFNCRGLHQCKRNDLHFGM